MSPAYMPGREVWPLSRQIAELEHELGVRLFERRPTRLTQRPLGSLVSQ